MAHVPVVEALQDLGDRQRHVALREVVADVVHAIGHRVAHVVADLLDHVLTELGAGEIALEIAG